MTAPLKFIRPTEKDKALFEELQRLVEQHQRELPLVIILAIFANMTGGIGASCRNLTHEQADDTIRQNVQAGWEAASEAIRSSLS